MLPVNVVFTDKDKAILESYRITARGLADYLGEGCEVVLHSLEDLEHSVIEIIGGHQTGRKQGSPITDLALSMLGKLNEQSSSDYITYFNRNRKNRPLKSSTIIIRGEQGNPIGLLCMNYYLDTPFASILQNYTPEPIPFKNTGFSESFTDNVDDLIKDSLDEVRDRVNLDPTISPSNKNKEIVHQLYQKGVFNLKDAVIKIADLLGISKNTVYMHIRNLHIKP